MTSRRSLTALYVLGLALFGLSCVAGIVYALTQERSIPPLSLSYPSHINRLIGEERWEEALEQMHRAALIETDSVGLYREMARVAAEVGDLERARFAGRSWAKLDAMDPAAHAILCVSLLKGLSIKRIGTEELALVDEAMEHGQRLIALEPESARGYFCHGVALLMHGSHSGAPIDFLQGEDRLARALKLDPTIEGAGSLIRFARSKAQQ